MSKRSRKSRRSSRRGSEAVELKKKNFLFFVKIKQKNCNGGLFLKVALRVFKLFFEF